MSVDSRKAPLPAGVKPGDPIMGSCPICGRRFQVGIAGARGRPRETDTDVCRDVLVAKNVLQKKIDTIAGFATPPGWRDLRSELMMLGNSRAVNKGVPLTPAQAAARKARNAKSKGKP